MATDRDRNELDPRWETYRHTGEVELRNRLVEDHLTLALAFARRYSRRGIPAEDLEQVARLGLIGAVERFDPTQGVRFETFAGRTIDGELKRHFRDKAWAVRVSRRHQDLGIAVRAALDNLAKELGRTPTVPELAEAVGAEVDDVLAAMEAAKAYTADSIDAPPTTGDGPREGQGGRLPSSVDVAPGQFDDRDQVARLLADLPERERRILELRFFGELSQRDIATELGISQMHVSRLLRNALADLRAKAVDD